MKKCPYCKGQGRLDDGAFGAFATIQCPLCRGDKTIIPELREYLDHINKPMVVLKCLMKVNDIIYDSRDNAWKVRELNSVSALIVSEDVGNFVIRLNVPYSVLELFYEQKRYKDSHSV